jgi:MscS family membrane protein
MQKICLILLSILFGFQGIGAQDYPLNFENPRNAMHWHLYYLSQENYQPEQSAKAFNTQDPGQAKVLALHLKEILDAKGFFIVLSEISNNPNYLDSSTGLNRLAPLPLWPDLVLEKTGEGWKYGSGSFAAIQKEYSSVHTPITRLLKKWIPESSSQTPWPGFHLWQYVGVALLLFVLWLIHRIQMWLMQHIVYYLIKSPIIPKEVRMASHKMLIPLSYYLLTLSVVVFLPSLMLPLSVSRFVFWILRLAVPLLLTFSTYRTVDLLMVVLKRRAEKTVSTLDDQLIPLLRKFLKAVVLVLGAVWILSRLDFNVTALLAGVSLGGLAFALAAQDTLKNMFGSLLIFLDKPFQVGDWIQADSIDGTVEEVGFRSTRVRTFANSVIYVPNGKLSDMMVNNMGMRKYRRFNTHLGLKYGTPSEKIRLFVDGLKGIVMRHPKTRKEYYEIHLNGLGAYSIDVLFYIFFDVPTWSEELKARQEILLEILGLAEQVGVEFAFPSQTLHVESLPEPRPL